MDQRAEFIGLAQQAGANIRELSRRYAISPTTAYKWLNRYSAAGNDGDAGLAEHSRRPTTSPSRTKASMEKQIVAARAVHPKWGARKLKRWLANQGVNDLPAASTVHAILLRSGLINPLDSTAHQPWHRFEHPAPNDLWQMDFKGHFAVGSQTAIAGTAKGSECLQARCHPLTVLDDHSRFVVCLSAQGNEQFTPTQQRLIHTFRRYGLPKRMTMDNGSPWGEPGRYTRFELWLMRLGIRVTHSRPYHPQTQGKDERFHRTLKAEVLQDQWFADLHHAQQQFDQWLPIYNQERPHEALQMNTPASRYTSSPRAYPEHLPELEYNAHDTVRKVQGKGELHYQGKTYLLGQAFSGQPVALRRTSCDGTMQVYFSIHLVATMTLTTQSIVIEKERRIEI